MASNVSITMDWLSQVQPKNAILLIGWRKEIVFIVTGQLAVLEECDKIIDWGYWQHGQQNCLNHLLNITRTGLSPTPSVTGGQRPGQASDKSQYLLFCLGSQPQFHAGILQIN